MATPYGKLRAPLCIFKFQPRKKHASPAKKSCFQGPNSHHGVASCLGAQRAAAHVATVRRPHVVALAAASGVPRLAGEQLIAAAEPRADADLRARDGCLFLGAGQHPCPDRGSYRILPPFPVETGCTIRNSCSGPNSTQLPTGPWNRGTSSQVFCKPRSNDWFYSARYAQA